MTQHRVLRHAQDAMLDTYQTGLARGLVEGRQAAAEEASELRELLVAMVLEDDDQHDAGGASRPCVAHARAYLVDRRLIYQPLDGDKE